MKAKTLDWFTAAESDTTAAEILMGNVFLSTVVSFHCQQAVEKVLKAILEEHEEEVPKIHRLITLVELVKKWYEPDIDLRVILFLDKLYLNSRYPGDFGLLPDGIPTQAEIQEFLQAAKVLYDQVKALLG